ncbi:hypothetical protein Poli38472_003624 [Pythium oligandrum]|uniref:Uncharacterized protein n=1 Tax=Pythium oligandrum TaxID=41045 RepID=A0A8K1CLR7_PYTOL|nr:hypothetical protein Poli38472_003624 [Pythium oligandrum]|eukprot:TMW65859.1 hypothetical protein Poli38472_003624 [Pythium oligandrum]
MSVSQVVMTPSTPLLLSVLYESVSADERRCVVCKETIKQMADAGFDGLLSHLEDAHKGYQAVVERCIASGNTKATPDMFKDEEEHEAVVEDTPSASTSDTEISVRPEPSIEQEPSRGFRLHQGSRYSKEDLDALLSCIEEILPTSGQQWEQLLNRYHQTYAIPNGRMTRTTPTIKARYYHLLARKRELPDEYCPVPVQRAREIRRRMREVSGQSGRYSVSEGERQSIAAVRAIVEPREQSSDEETIPDEEMAQFIAAEEAQATAPLSRRKRPRHDEPSGDDHQALVDRVTTLEGELSSLQRELLSLCEVVLNTTNALEEEKAKNSELREELARLTGRPDLLDADTSSEEDASELMEEETAEDEE